MVRIDSTVSFLGPPDSNKGEPVKKDAAQIGNSTAGPKQTGGDAHETDGVEKGDGDGEEDEDKMWGAFNAMMRSAKLADRLDPHGFAQQLFSRIAHWADSTDKAHPAELARRYRVLPKLISCENPPKLGVQRRNQLRTDLETTQGQLARWYLQHEIRIIFATCSTAANEKLTSRWEPDVIIVEDAGYCSIRELVEPLAAYKESVKQVIMAGDYNNQKPRYASEGRNEAWHLIKDPIFERCCKGAEEGADWDYMLLHKKFE